MRGLQLSTLLGVLWAGRDGIFQEVEAVLSQPFSQMGCEILSSPISKGKTAIPTTEQSPTPTIPCCAEVSFPFSLNCNWKLHCMIPAQLGRRQDASCEYRVPRGGARCSGGAGPSHSAGGAFSVGRCCAPAICLPAETVFQARCCYLLMWGEPVDKSGAD